MSRLGVKLGGLAASWAAWAARHAIWLLVCLIALAAAAGYAGYRVLDLDFRETRIVARDVPFRQAARQAEALFPWIAGGAVTAIVEADDPTIAREAASRLTAALDDRPSLFSDVFAPGLGPFYEQNGLLLLSPQETQAVAARLRRWMPLIDLLHTQPDLVGLSTALDQLGIAAQMNIFPREGAALLTELDRVIQSLIDQKPATVDWQGILVGDLNRNRQQWRISVQLSEDPAAFATLRALAQDPAITGPGRARIALAVGQGSGPLDLSRLTGWALHALVVAFVLAAIVALLALRSIRLFIASLLASAVSLALVAGAAGALVGSLTLPAYVLAIVIVALSFDGPFLAALRYREERLAGREHPLAIAGAAYSFGPPLLIYALVMAVAFAAFWATGLTGIAKLAGFAAAAMGIMWLVTMVAMPALLSILPLTPRQRAGVGGQVLQTIGAALTAQPVRLAITLPIMVAAITAMFLLHQVEFDRDLDHGAGIGSQGAAHVLVKGVGPARDVIARLEAMPEVAGVASVFSFIPSGQSTKLAMLRGIQASLPEARESELQVPGELPAETNALVQLSEVVHSLTQSSAPPEARAAAGTLEDTIRNYIEKVGSDGAAVTGLESALVGSLRETTVRVRALADANRISLDTLDSELKRRFLSPSDDYLIEVSAKGDLGDTETLRRFVSAVQSVAPDASGPAIDAVATGSFLKTSSLFALAIASAGLALLLFLTLPKIYDVLLVSVPIGLAGLILTGATVVMGLKIIPLALVALPILIGIGVGNCVKMIMRARESMAHQGATRPSTPRAVFWSLLCVMAVSALLLLSPLPSLVVVGRFLVMGGFLLLLCIFLVLPTLVQLTLRRDSH
ncbi:MMPL family transporter [Rhodoligotrophos ferricapiens]|uniref:MMPL family transporter n=1 Tax=Rhodoligotrophos ferricapiens TaxID=3069264 RepID=UPI00315CABB3